MILSASFNSCGLKPLFSRRAICGSIMNFAVALPYYYMNIGGQVFLRVE